MREIIVAFMIYSTLFVPAYADHGLSVSISILTREASFERDKDLPIRLSINNNRDECVLLYDVGVAFDGPTVERLPKEALKIFILPESKELAPSSFETFTVNMRVPSDAPPGDYIIKSFAKATSCTDPSHQAVLVTGPRLGLQVDPPPESQCIIATATYGSELAPEVQFLRNFRDTIVLSTYSGTNFMTLFDAFYYSWSPGVADTIRDNDGLKSVSRIIISPLLNILKVGSLAGEQSETGVMASGILSSMLIGAVYVTPLSACSLFALKKSVRKHHLMYLSVAWVTAIILTVTATVLRVDMLMMVSAGMLVLSSIALAAIGLTFAFTRLWRYKKQKFLLFWFGLCLSRLSHLFRPRLTVFTLRMNSLSSFFTVRLYP